MSPGDLVVPESRCSVPRHRIDQETGAAAVAIWRATDTQLNGNLLRYVHSHKGFGSLASYALIDSGVRGRTFALN